MSGRFRGSLQALNYAPRIPRILLLSLIFIYSVLQTITFTSWYVSVHTGTSYVLYCPFIVSVTKVLSVLKSLFCSVAQPFAHKAQLIFKTPSSVSRPLQGKIVEVYLSGGDQCLGSCCFLVICWLALSVWGMAGEVWTIYHWLFSFSFTLFGSS